MLRTLVVESLSSLFLPLLSHYIWRGEGRGAALKKKNKKQQPGCGHFQKLTRKLTSFKMINLCNWDSEANPTLGCSIEISRDIYMYIYVCMSSIVYGKTIQKIVC